MAEMIEKRMWEEFREAGFLWFVNRILHVFGWAIVVEVELNEDGTPTNEIFKVYPARVKFRGFTRESEENGFKKITQYMFENAGELLKQSLE